MQILVELNSQDRVIGVFAEGISKAIPAGAVPVSEADGKMIRQVRCLGDYVLTNGALVLDTAFAAARELDAARGKKKAEIEVAREAARFAPVTATVGGATYTWQADQKSVDLLNGAISVAQAGGALPAAWRTLDNVDVPIASLADLLAIAQAIATQTQAAYAKSWALKGQVDKAATAADVDAVAW